MSTGVKWLDRIIEQANLPETCDREGGGDAGGAGEARQPFLGSGAELWIGGDLGVRGHAVARIEIAEEELPSALSAARLRKMSAAVRAAGFNYVALDCDGYRSGSMNEILPVEVLTRDAQD